MRGPGRVEGFQPVQRADPEVLVELLREDVRLTIEPGIGEWTGRPAVAEALRRDMNTPGRWRMLPTAFGLPASLDPGTLPGGLPPHARRGVP